MFRDDEDEHNKKHPEVELTEPFSKQEIASAIANDLIQAQKAYYTDHPKPKQPPKFSEDFFGWMSGSVRNATHSIKHDNYSTADTLNRHAQDLLSSDKSDGAIKKFLVSVLQLLNRTPSGSLTKAIDVDKQLLRIAKLALALTKQEVTEEAAKNLVSFHHMNQAMGGKTDPLMALLDQDYNKRLSQK